MRNMCELSTVRTNFDTEVKIANIKKEHIENIIRTAPMCPAIVEIVVFGSVLEERCTDRSDIDMLIISDKQKSRLFRDRRYTQFKNKIFTDGNFEQNYDFICMNDKEKIEEKSASSALFRDIQEYGKTIYRREDSNG